MIKKIVMLFASLVLAFSLVGCGSAHDGMVYDKDHIDAYTSYDSVPDYIWVSQYNPATKTTMMQQQYVGSHEVPHYHQECWLIKFRNTDNKTGDDCVSETQWQTIQIGQHYAEN